MNRETFAHDRWAADQLLDAAAALDGDAFTRDLGNSFPSLAKTFEHIAWAEWLWLRRVKYGESPRQRWNELNDVAAVREAWRPVQEEWRDYVASLTEEELDREVSYVNSKDETWTYSVRRILTHLTHHSAYHRGQIVTMLRLLGAKVPPSTDFLVWVDAGAPTSAATR